MTRIWADGSALILRDDSTSGSVRIPFAQLDATIARMVKLALARQPASEWDEPTPVESPSGRTRVGRKPPPR